MSMRVLETSANDVCRLFGVAAAPRVPHAGGGPTHICVPYPNARCVRGLRSVQ
jgi:hypothetical protein